LNNKKNFLLSDILPYEIPIIYSNYNLFSFINSCKEWDDIKISKDELKQISVPYNFFITKSNDSLRMISLVHPLGQLQILKFIEKYDQEFIDYADLNNIFSIRHPQRVNFINKRIYNKFERQLNSILDIEFETGEGIEQQNMEVSEEIIPRALLGSYFQYRKYFKITDFYGSNELRAFETKYTILLKLDIQNCFYNIYTHSIDWAYLGDKNLAKNNIGNTERFSSLLDNLMQRVNYNETNGIVVGPEFSRCVAELILMRVDKIVYNKMTSQDVIYKNDYEVARFMDDIFVFCNDTKVADKIKKAYQEVCSEYKLSLNEQKTYIEYRPFIRKNVWVADLKKILKQYTTIFEDNIDKKKNQYFIDENLINEIKCLLIEYEEQKDNLVSYILSYFENNLKGLVERINKLGDDAEKVVKYCRIIDIIQYVLAFSLTAINITKYCRITSSIFIQGKRFSNEVVSEILFKKGYELLKYNKSRNIELLNLIIIMKNYPKDLPEGILLDFLAKDKEYFTLATLAFYIDTEERIYKYNKTRKEINDIIYNITKNMIELYFSNNTDDVKIRNLICSKDFCLIHDFYTSRILYENVRLKIDEIKKIINKMNINYKNISGIFINYIKDFDKPFMNWKATNDDLVKYIVQKSSGGKLDSRLSG
jgi:hypothetical protein